MCTAIGCNFESFYFGRTLDLDCSYGENVVLTPRNFPLYFRDAGLSARHYAILGMATVKDNFPLYYDAVNEKGLCMAGLRFADNAYYQPDTIGRLNIAPFELILYILSGCSSVNEAKRILDNISIADIPFSSILPNTPLHWIIADKDSSITVEAVREGLFVYDNKIGVLTNNPPFPIMKHRLNNYAFLDVKEKEPVKFGSLSLEKYSLGLGALGLPGDFSSESRFIRVAFLKENSIKSETPSESVSQFFHIMSSVNIPKGCVLLPSGQPHYTVYTSCINAKEGVYHYKTYQNQSVSSVSMRKLNLDQEFLSCFD